MHTGYSNVESSHGFPCDCPEAKRRIPLAAKRPLQMPRELQNAKRKIRWRTGGGMCCDYPSGGGGLAKEVR